MRRFAFGLAALALVGVAVVLGSVPRGAGAATTTVVNPGSLVPYTTPLGSPGWYFWNDKDDLPTGSPGALVAGPATPPLGTGSVELGPLTDGGATAGGHSVIATNGYSGTALADITSLSYSTYQPGPILAIAIQFDVKYRATDTAYGGRLVFEPYQNGAVIVGSGWQSWSPLAGVWWATKTNAAGTGGAQVVALPAGNCAISTPCTWAQINAAFPAAQILGRFLLKAGSGWAGFDGNADNLTIGVSGSDTTYDFEPSCSTDCYVRTDGDDTNAGTADTPALAKKTIQAAVNTVSPGGTVHVAAGTYAEQVTINKSLLIDGAGMGSTFVEPSGVVANATRINGNPAAAIFDVEGPATVNIQNLTADGSLNGIGGCSPDFVGFYYKKASGTLSNVAASHINLAPALMGCGTGVGIFAEADSPDVANVVVNNSTVADYDKGGIVGNRTGTTLTVANSTITGFGPSDQLAQNGVQIGFGAKGNIHDNIISGNECTVIADCTADPTSAANADGASGVLLYHPGAGTVPVQNNTLTGNQFGIWAVGATDVNVKQNVISGGGTGIAIWDCDQWCPDFGLSPVGTTGTMNSNTLSGQAYGLLVRDYAAGAPVPNLAAHQNSITGSSTDGAWANVALNATDNWWGSSSGPKHPSNTFNVPLQGVNVSNNVTFVPWLNAAPPVGVSFAPVTDTSPVGSFSSIQAGVNASNPGGTVNAKAGTFTENVTVGQQVTIAGAGIGSTFVIPALSSPNPCGGASLCGGSESNIMLIQANNVTIHDMTLEGDNPGLVSGLLVAGADLDARNGIITNHLMGVYQNLTVHHVSVKDIYLRGLYASSGGTFNFHHDNVSNVQGDPASIGMFNFGGSGNFSDNSVTGTNDAVSSNHSRGTTFLNNIITSSGSGVHTDNAGDGGGSADLLDGNTVSNCTPFGFGVWTFVPYIQPTVKRNVINNCAVGLAATGSFVPVGTLFQDNDANGMGLAGSTGVYITTNLFGFGSGNVSATLTGNIIRNNQDGIFYESEPGYTLTVNNLGNAIYGNSSTGASTSGTGSFNVKMLGDWWGSATGPTHALNPGGTGDSVADGIPYSPWLGIGTDASVAPGFQMASPMTWVVGTNVCDVTCIQRAVDLSSSGDTVSALAGTFVEQVDIGKVITLTGAGAGTTFIKSPASLATKFVTSADNKPVVYVHATGGTIEQLTVDGDGKGNANYRISGIAFYNAGGTVDHVDIVHVRETPLSGTQHGVALYANNTDFVARTLTATNMNISDYQKNGMALNGDGLTVDVEDNVVTGAGPTPLTAQNGIQVAFGATGTVSGNNVSGNDYSNPLCSPVVTGSCPAAATGVLVYLAASGTTLSGNNVHDNMEGLDLEGSAGLTVNGNTITNVRDAAIFANASANGSYTGNTITGLPTSSGLYLYDTSTNNAVSGNAFRLNGTGVVVDFSAGAPTGNHFNNNCIADNTDGMLQLGTLSGGPIDATTNWWGRTDGPTPPGHGDTISPAASFNVAGFLSLANNGCAQPSDGDADGVNDTFDNCPNIYNPSQLNSDSAPVDNGPGVAGNDGTISNGDGLGDACDPDNDNDSLNDVLELSPTGCGAYDLSTTTHPNPVFGDVTNDDNHNGNAAPIMGTDAADNGPSWDTDNDGVRDGVECALGTNPRDRTSKPTVAMCGGMADADNDGLTAAEEHCKWGTNDALTDSDGDGFRDCVEANDNDGNGVANFPGDTINSAKAANALIGKTQDFDLNGDGVVNFPGDTVLSAQMVNHVGGVCQ